MTSCGEWFEQRSLAVFQAAGGNNARRQVSTSDISGRTQSGSIFGESVFWGMSNIEI